MRLPRSFLCILVLAFAAQAPAAIPSDPAAVVPVEVGARAPGFIAREVDGRPFQFNPTALQKPALLIFFRGGWCPYCNAHLQDLHIVEPQIVAQGYQVLFLSTDKPDLLYSSLKEKVTYHLLSDSSLSAAEAYGVAWHVEGAALQSLKSYGIDLDATQGTSRHELPVPAVFIIDRSGVIRFRYYNPDFRVRLDAASVMAAARNALGKS
jgi:peroxiredoxin